MDDHESEEKDELQQSYLSNEEIDEIVDEMIKEINVQFKKEIKDEITRNEIIHFIKNKYGMYFKISKIETVIDDDINKFKRDCFYWLFILHPIQNQTNKIYITI